MRLWYDTPAKNWNEALPIGNGSLGAMVHGHVEEEILNLNEETLWYRGASDRNNPDSLNYLDEIRELLLEEKITEAEELVRQAMFATPRDQSHYEALGELYLTHNNIDINDIISYERELDIEKAIASVKYRTKTTRYSREIFISKKLNMLVMNFEADGEDKIDFEVRIERKKDLVIV
ncbi:glycoside hydrolase family 95 protein [Dolosigranulum pigrum]|uniref:glycoside hydrolase family 95 protein n=1 Tax=Dolosigranulum pigrum TaxID=29394 RepID=UPI001AD89408|nr:glycoside hydrolase family 95 protein [Dolosigranulum pigrum]QTJ54007.1 glycoside hydrolase family 95 protein [Dolosigranulum pigrum]